MDNPYQIQQDKGRTLAMAALILGFASAATTIMLTVWFPYFFGSLAVLLAILSTGDRSVMDPRAKAGFRTAVFAMIINTVIIVASIYAFYTDENLQKAFFENFEALYGMSFEDFMNMMRGGTVR